MASWRSWVPSGISPRMIWSRSLSATAEVSDRRGIAESGVVLSDMESYLCQQCGPFINITVTLAIVYPKRVEGGLPASALFRSWLRAKFLTQNCKRLHDLASS